MRRVGIEILTSTARGGGLRLLLLLFIARIVPRGELESESESESEPFCETRFREGLHKLGGAVNEKVETCQRMNLVRTHCHRSRCLRNSLHNKKS